MNDSKMSLIGAGRDFTLACSEQPQSRMELLGPASLSDAELLALFLGGPTGSRKMDLAHQLIAAAGSLAGLSKLAAMDFRQLPGVGQVRSQLLVAVLEMSRRMTQTTAETTVLNRPELIADYMQPTVRELEVEKFWVLCLNRKNRLKRKCEVTSGTATSSLAHPREVFRCAIRESATSIVCVHNHPSGDPAPSAADVQVTRLWEASHKRVYGNCRIMGIGLSDRRRVSTGTSHDDGVGASHN